MGIKESRATRRRQTAECFTPKTLVQEILVKLPEDVWQEDKTFLDPSCGNGNILLEVLRTKLDHGINSLFCLQNIYGTDIMEDNIYECRLRLLKLIQDRGFEINQAMIETILTNIICTDLLTYINGSLDYDFSFNQTDPKEKVQDWVKNIKYVLSGVDADFGIIEEE